MKNLCTYLVGLKNSPLEVHNVKKLRIYPHQKTFRQISTLAIHLVKQFLLKMCERKFP